MRRRTLKPLRLNKYLAQATALSRRAADRAIAAGEIRLNGAVITKLGICVDPETDRIEYRGEPIRHHALRHSGTSALRHSGTGTYTYLAFYKPRHSLVSKADPRGRATIWQWLAGHVERCNAAGRLDFESEGLLLITDDGGFIQRLTHPRFGVTKTYHVKVRGLPDAGDVARLGKGMVLDGVRYQPTPVRLLRTTERNGWIEMVLREGKFREVRKLCDAIGHPVLKLKRVAVGPVRLGDLKPGKARPLRAAELSALRRPSEPTGSSPRAPAGLRPSRPRPT